MRLLLAMANVDRDAIMRLSVRERVGLVQDIWDTLQPSAEELPLTEAQQRTIDTRLEEHRRDPTSAVPLEQVKARIESR